MATIALPFAAGATRRAPSTDELANGYGCGDADLELFNFLAWYFSGQIAGAIDAGGLTVDDAILPRLAQAIQSGKSTYAVATGTANAWVVAPNLAVPAYAAGRALHIIAPATNTSTTVNMNVSGLGNRRIKKQDGSDPAIGDLASGVAHATIDDGTNIRILGPLPSDAADGIATQQMAHVIGGLSATWPYNTLTTVYFTADRQLFRDPATTFVSGVLTVGPKDAGLWLVNAWTNFVRTDTTMNWGYVIKNGVQQAVSGDTGSGSASGSNAVVSQAVLLANGDSCRVQALQQNAGTASQSLVSRVSMFRLSA